MSNEGNALVVVANRLPVDFTVDDAGEISWKRSPGGLVSALEPVMQQADGAWVGWNGSPDLYADPFEADGMTLVPVTLNADEIEQYYEGFSNDTLWPLYHDVIAPPAFHRQWWDAYRRVNRRFAEAAAVQVATGGTVWVHDYQLQLVPSMLRELRPDVRIGFFDHIPFPPYEIFAQLPWRRQVIEGLLGADLIGFQRNGDAANFLRTVRRLTRHSTRGQVIAFEDKTGRAVREVRASAFPISIDSQGFDALARREDVVARAEQIREELGKPDIIMLGVDRLDYTKGIRHRIKAYGELLHDGRLGVEETTLVQVASPSRENVGAYQELRDQVETAVGRINGDYGELGHAAIHYLHHSYPPEEMAALYRASDVVLVTSLRDGMNLVAKEYIAARSDDRGALVLSEFTGAADELNGALLVNPHDIDELKDVIERAARLTPEEQRKRMRRLRRKVMTDDVAKWSRTFLETLEAMPVVPVAPELADGDATEGPSLELVRALDDLAATDGLVLVASDFDGVLAPLVDDPASSRTSPRAARALGRIARRPESQARLALVSGRDLATLAELSRAPLGTLLIGSHGAERGVVTAVGFDRRDVTVTEGQASLLAHITDGLEEIAGRHTGVWVERKPTASVLHTRKSTHDGAAQATEAARALAERLGVGTLEGKDVVEIQVVDTSKGKALDALRTELGAVGVLYLGDDVTDEHAFAVLGSSDVSVKVGGGETIAEYRVPGTTSAALLLEHLGRALEHRSKQRSGGA
ncbi:bifunctional alpha,alpha-trehalose-phosphate synthase (UDP-forming)/trehalose-phosphatase [Luteimicrobium subarcticum]|uniref:Trehalose 6-phosphate synthase/phosphatase n=1 Tax=Luteimicrobium subarcticum TaxID=620910 RepID=A0A2M8WT15_9MICO|nr:bifunctional alpha,alpha-trehalose-phosphate synthase (UDP-forming)/trehalose-phosphatase [Luteimicrobium subarcticum]PJI93976.1 trehalose 6-phosphate synthase/phosphatase [Luteimicrobium subarcticum]